MRNSPPFARERRRHVRYSVNDTVTVTVLLPPQLTQFCGHATDLSKEGISLLVDHEITRGSIVEIALRNSSIIGEIKNCRPVGPKFRVGVSITDLRVGSVSAGPVAELESRTPN